MGRSWFYALIFCAFSVTPAAAVHKPQPGWCRTAHRPKKKAQTGYDGYCKLCFKSKFPEKYAEKNARRHRQCVVCLQERELVHKLFCKPCFRARSCEKCGAVNREEVAVQCWACLGSREALGATQRRLAMWCSACFDPGQLLLGLCEACSHRREKCHQCDEPETLFDKVLVCAEPGCAARMWVLYEMHQHGCCSPQGAVQVVLACCRRPVCALSYQQSTAWFRFPQVLQTLCREVPLHSVPVITTC